MSQSFGPHRPEEGWGLRWLIQAAQLCFRTPTAFVFLGVWVMISGVLSLASITALPGLWGFILSDLTLTALSVVALIFTMQILLKEDGHGEISIPLVLERSKPVVKAVIVIEVMFLCIALGLVMAFPPAVSDTPASAPSGIADLISRAGLMVVSGVYPATIIILPLWIAVSAGMEMPLAQARRASGIMFTRMHGVWMVTALGPILAASFISKLPWVASIPLTFLLISWTYVAAREIFGGISHNGEQERETKLSHV